MDEKGTTGGPGEESPAKPSGGEGKVFSFEDEEQMKALKEIKVKLPVSQHIKLHSLKITRNRSISEVVMKALEDYFSRMEGAPEEGSSDSAE